MKEHARQIVAGLSAAIALVILTYATNFVFWFNILIAGLLGLGMYFTIPRKKSDDEIEVAPGITKAQANAALEYVAIYVEKFAVEEQKCRTSDMRSTIQSIRKSLEKIGDNFRRDPQDLSMADRFLTQYLEKSYTVVNKYNRLAAMKPDDRLAAQLKNVEESIERIRRGFDGFYRKCLENDLYNLEVESETLDAILEMDQPFLELEERSGK
jgi:hypothetical protein